jgi:tRNA (guanine37-N1)-methyltransferase
VTLFAILTLFPEACEAYAREGILRVAQEAGKVRIHFIDFRDFARDRHRTVDDRPFGGGPGMLLKPEPIAECVEWLEARHGPFRRLLLCPAGRTFRQRDAVELAREERVLLVAGRYEGFDARLVEELGFEELSIGDYVLAGGELPALVVTEAIVRLLPGVLGDERSAAEDSFGPTGELDCRHYTRPRIWRGRAVPDVLLSGDHAAIERWRVRERRERTARAEGVRHQDRARPPASLPVPEVPPPHTGGPPRSADATFPAGPWKDPGNEAAPRTGGVE